MTIMTGSLQKIQQGSLLFQYLGTYTSTLNVITSGMFYGWPSPSLPKLQSNTSTIPTTTDQGSWMAVMPLISAVIGSLIAGSTVDLIGRKRMVLMSSIPYVASWLMIAFARSVEVIYVARFIAGLSDGLVFTSVPIYIGEISDPSVRGLLGASVSVTFIFGILLINIIGSYLSIYLTALVASCLPLITLVTFVFMPESPYQHVIRGHLEEAKRSLQKLRGMQDVDSELIRVTLAVKAERKTKGSFWDLFTDRVNRKAVFIMMIVRGAQQLSGASAIPFYAQTIFIEAGDNISSEAATIIFFSVQFCLSLFASIIVDRAGRRPLLIGSISGGALFLFMEGMYFYLKSYLNIDMTPYSVVPVVGLIGFIVIFSLGMGTIPLLMLGELFSSNAKAFALCFADIYFSVIATSVSKFFQIMKDSFGIYTPFFAFTFFSVCGLILIVLFVPETKGKTLEDIQAHFQKKNNLRIRKEKKQQHGAVENC